MKKTIIHSFKFILIITFLFLGASFLGAQEGSDREKQGQINYLYKMGTECYYQGKYSQAIKYWEAVLDIDPQQTQPPALIENAREQVQKESGPVDDKFKAAVKRGEFFEALEYNLKLLDLDPTNTDYKDSMTKIKKIVDIFTTLPKNSDVKRLVIQGVYAYIIKPVDIELAFSSLRLALQKDPNNKSIKDFFDQVKLKNPEASR
ncbi:MAG: tetratricopeptide repeat protein, partial [bacterium]